MIMRTLNVVSALLLLMKDMTDEERVEVFNTLDGEYCQHCGVVQPENLRGCSCRRDD